MKPYDTARMAEFSDDAFQKVNLYESDELFVDIYCFRPGQEQAPHVHAESEKIYHVLEGTATVTAGQASYTLTPGEIIHIPKGEPHGVRNDTEGVVRTLVMMAPLPGSGGGESGHTHEHVDQAERTMAVFTVSSSREEDEDESGHRLIELLEDDGHSVATFTVVNDDIDEIREAVIEAVAGVDCVILSGGTGITPDDVTFEAITPLFDKELPGFGEHLRRLSVDEIGSAVIMTRATAGIVDEIPVFSLPGSTNAVELAVSDIILPELDHVIDLASR